MRAFRFITRAALVCLAGCAAPADGTGTTGPGGPSTAALVDFTTPSVTMGGLGLQETVSVLVRDARGAIIPSAPVTWTSDNPGIVSVSGNSSTAALVSVSPGTARIRANAGTAASEVTVRVLAIRTVSIQQASVSIRTGDTQLLTAVVAGDAGALQSVRWTTDNPAIATVGAQGMVTGVSVGTTLIKAAAVGDPSITSSVVVTVTAARGVIVSPAVMTLWVGDADTLSAVPDVEGGQPRTVQWTSENPAVATVSAIGAVTAVGTGTATIVATSTIDPRIKGTSEVRVLPARTVSISPVTSTVSIGGSRTLVASVNIETGLSTAVTWRSSDASIATVSGTGLVTGVSLGTVNIIAVSVADTVRRFSATLTVTPSVNSITVSPTEMSLFPSERERATATVDVQGSLPRTVTWRSANTTIASVNASGDITGVAAGQTIIRAISTADTTKRAEIAVTVLPAPVLAVSPGQATMASGESRTFTALVNVAEGVDPGVMWRTNNSTVISVSQTGVVTAVGIGNATVTAVSVADTTRRANAIVAVVPTVRSLTLAQSAVNLFLGQAQQLNATIATDAGVSQTLIWRSSNTAAASVSGSGLVTAVAAGQTTITVLSSADTTKRATAAVTVSSRPLTITLSHGDFGLNVNGTQQISALVTADPGVGTGLAWSSSNSSVATVNSAGLVTAISQGTAQIIATSVADPSKSARLMVTVATRLASSWSASRASGMLYEDVLSIAGFNASSAFAVNTVGDIFRWNGSAWSVSARGALYNTSFTAVHGNTATNIIAVGTNGVIARFDGSSWTTMSSGTSRTLLDVFVESASTAYAVGSEGTILKLTGASWATMTSGTTESLHGVWSTGTTAVAVGANGEVLRLIAGVWAQQSSGTAETLYGVAGTSATNITAVGAFGTIVRFNGTTWSDVSSGGNSSDFYGIDGTTANGGRMYIASDGGLLQLDGTTLSAVTTPYQPRVFATSVEATGAAWTSGQRGAVFRGSGASFSTINLAPDLLDVWSTSETNAWAVGEFGFVYRWNGTAWTRQTTPTTATLNSVWGTSASEAFAGGENGVMLRWNGSSWTSMSLPVASNVYAIWGSSGNNVFAVTSGGHVLRYNGTAWSIATSVSDPLWAVYGVSSTEVYASGEQGRVLRFNGSTWTTMAPATSGILAGFWATGLNSIVSVGAEAGGSNGIAYRYDGSSWLMQSTGTTRVLTSVWGPAGTDLYATGENGTLLRFNGSSWTAMGSGTTELLWSVTGSPTGSGGAFAVGYNATILTGSGSGLLVASMRAGAAAQGDLEPSAQARRESRGVGAVPSGAARKSRAGRSGATGASRSTRTGIAAMKFGRGGRGR